jgi:hypothetical protein
MGVLTRIMLVLSFHVHRPCVPLVNCKHNFSVVVWTILGNTFSDWESYFHPVVPGGDCGTGRAEPRCVCNVEAGGPRLAYGSPRLRPHIRKQHLAWVDAGISSGAAPVFTQSLT